MRKLRILSILLFIFILAGCNVTPLGEDDLSITLKPGIDTVEINTAFVDAGVTAMIGTRTIEGTITENTVDITTTGQYTVTYEVSRYGYSKTVTRYVNIVDNTPPTLSLKPGVDTIIKGQTWTDAGVNAEDNSLGTVSVVVTGSANVNTAGEYVITYTGTDESGNVSTIIRYVNVLNTN
jgi:hypothetical protein